MAAIFGEFLKIPQEKGPEVELAVFGDEFYARYENRDGYSAVYDEDLGQFTYADLIDGGFVSTGVPITEKHPENIKEHLKESNEVRRAKAERRFAGRGSPTLER
jgi:hypothetical protein